MTAPTPGATGQVDGAPSRPAQAPAPHLPPMFEELLERIGAPDGWRVLRTDGRLEARWRSESGRWASMSLRLEPAPGGSDAHEDGGHRATVGDHHLALSFASSGSHPETAGAVQRLLEALR